MADRTPAWAADEIMSVVASRLLRDGMSCFVGIGIPSTVANLARNTHAPNLFLIYEAGPLGAKPYRLPLSIGDGELAETADAVVSVPEVFNYWLQGGHIDVGYLSAAQVDRFGNLNTTVIGPDYHDPKVRLPGAGGAPEIAAHCHEVTVIMRHTRRAFVPRVDFVTSVGLGPAPDTRSRLGFRGAGPDQRHHRPGDTETRSAGQRADPGGGASGCRHARCPGSDPVAAQGGITPRRDGRPDQRGVGGAPGPQEPYLVVGLWNGGVG